MTMQQQIEDQVKQMLTPIYMRVDNESHMHAGPAADSHFKLVLVSPAFEGLARVKRHQCVYKALAAQMTHIHALALHTYSPKEWQDSQTIPTSPLCASRRN
ncbi:BolA family protein [Thiomicrospira microaerophila]|uniref:BolA family protein n=1 Tax=Thiomicrospira microaerophila TaxID=406020 RepID=UPI0005CAD96A|nr:BolA family protein [Thiomicrospira microaerophila]